MSFMVMINLENSLVDETYNKYQGKLREIHCTNDDECQKRVNLDETR